MVDVITQYLGQVLGVRINGEEVLFSDVTITKQVLAKMLKDGILEESDEYQEALSQKYFEQELLEIMRRMFSDCRSNQFAEAFEKFNAKILPDLGKDVDKAVLFWRKLHKTTKIEELQEYTLTYKQAEQLFKLRESGYGYSVLESKTLTGQPAKSKKGKKSYNFVSPLAKFKTTK